jgi:hypothetical protein
MTNTPHFVLLFALSIGVGNLAGCNASSKSDIVRQFQAAGGGNPDTADSQGIMIFLNQRPDLSKQLMLPCNDRMKTANANWTQTGEGKICASAAQVVATRNFFAVPTGPNTDTRTFSPIPHYKK